MARGAHSPRLFTKNYAPKTTYSQDLGLSSKLGTPENYFDEQLFLDLLTKLIAQAKYLQNNPKGGLVPKEELAASIVVNALRPYALPNGPLKVLHSNLKRVSAVSVNVEVVALFPSAFQFISSLKGWANNHSVRFFVALSLNVEVLAAIRSFSERNPNCTQNVNESSTLVVLAVLRSLNPLSLHVGPSGSVRLFSTQNESSSRSQLEVVTYVTKRPHS